MSLGITDAVIIPARNEQERLATCLSALAPQVDARVLVVVVANNCTDGTARAARGILPDRNFDLLECRFRPSQGVGEARRRGCRHALTRHPGIRALMTTDADCMVAPDWIATTRRHLTEVDAVCGRVGPIPSETAALAHMPPQEAAYRDLVLEFHDLLAPERHCRYPHHGEAAGASLGCRVSAYRTIGGFADLRTGEDREFVRRLRAAGFRVRHAADIRVRASFRLHGRAPGGMADTLRERLAGLDYLVDEALPSVAELVAMARRGRLAPWPHDTPQARRLRPADLPQEIRRLKDLIGRIRAGHAIVGLPAADRTTRQCAGALPPPTLPEIHPDA